MSGIQAGEVEDLGFRLKISSGQGLTFINTWFKCLWLESKKGWWSSESSGCGTT